MNLLKWLKIGMVLKLLRQWSKLGRRIPLLRPVVCLRTLCLLVEYKLGLVNLLLFIRGLVILLLLKTIFAFNQQNNSPPFINFWINMNFNLRGLGQTETRLMQLFVYVGIMSLMLLLNPKNILLEEI